MASTSKIILRNGKVATISKEDEGLVTQYTWSYNLNRYATATNKGDTIYMHRLIMGLEKGDGKLVDHVNGDGLDNRRENLRVCDKTQNQQNQKPRHTKVSKYKGVGYYKRDEKWRARIVVNKVDTELGKFESEIEAALAYDKAAEKYHGEFAWLNRDHFNMDTLREEVI